MASACSNKGEPALVGVDCSIDRLNGANDRPSMLIHNADLINFIVKIKSLYSVPKDVHRCAAKLNVLQRKLFTLNMPYAMVRSIMDHHRFDRADVMITSEQLASLTHDIMFAGQKIGFYSTENDGFDLKRATDQIMQFFWITNSNRISAVPVLHVRLVFLMLCSMDSYRLCIQEHFDLIADYNGCVSSHKFHAMIKIIAKIIACIDDIVRWKDADISSECFERAKCLGLAGLSEYQFSSLWHLPDTQFAFYSDLIRLLQQLQAPEQTDNINLKCSGCQIQLISGVIFKCTRCIDFYLCFECYAKVFHNNKHKVSHKMCEHNPVISMSNKFVTLVMKLCRIFNKSSVVDNHNHTSTSNQVALPNDTVETEVDLMDSKSVTVLKIADASKLNVTDDLTLIRSRSTTVNLNQAVMNRITTVIEFLSEQNKLIHKKLMSMDRTIESNRNIIEFMEDHKKILAEQIMQLRHILHRSRSQAHNIASSTPYRTNGKHRNDMTNPFGFSRNINLYDTVRSNRAPTEIGMEATLIMPGGKTTDYSITDVSTWFHQKNVTLNRTHTQHSEFDEIPNLNTEMSNFKVLLQKVKQIAEDSYSDNIELSQATRQLEDELDKIIFDEERKRLQSLQANATLLP